MRSERSLSCFATEHFEEIEFCFAKSSLHIIIDFPLEQLMQAWQVLNEFLNSYKGVDANYVITSADPDSNHKLDPAHPANAISPTEELAFQKSLIKEIGKLSQLS